MDIFIILDHWWIQLVFVMDTCETLVIFSVPLSVVVIRCHVACAGETLHQSSMTQFTSPLSLVPLVLMSTHIPMPHFYRISVGTYPHLSSPLCHSQHDFYCSTSPFRLLNIQSSTVILHHNWHTSRKFRMEAKEYSLPKEENLLYFQVAHVCFQEGSSHKFL